MPPKTRGATRSPTRALVLVLGDQLSPRLSSLRAANRKTDRILMVEVAEEATYVRHHKKKIAFIFAAMRHFAEELRASGWTVEYRTLEETGYAGSFTSEVRAAVERLKPERVIVTEPGEWRVREAMGAWTRAESPDALSVPTDMLDDDRFLATHKEFETWAHGRKQLRMEYFYRDMRRKTGLLMQGADPIGGQWNFDHDNRKPARADLFMPTPAQTEPDAITKSVLDLVATRFADHLGSLKPFWFAVTRRDAERALDHFIEHALPRFGEFQDAMLKGEKFLYHSVLSAYINVGLLDPLVVCRRVEAAYHAGQVPLNSAEGFIRQIIGWREYVRGIYWLRMPSYSRENKLNHKRPLPPAYWTGDTDMACLKAAIQQTIDEAYAHHIQRLMVTGNFALLAGCDPHEVHEWYLMVYADAFEWVELPNTLGMSQFADGGLLASKPYVASGAYINRMSDYCKGCRYDVKARTGKDACPMNVLYWAFLIRHRKALEGNPRMAQMYRVYDKFSETEKRALQRDAEVVLQHHAPEKKLPGAKISS